MLRQLIIASGLVAFASAACSQIPNNTDKAMHWWQCDSGASAKFYNATPYDQTGNNYEYPIHLSKPIVVKTDLDNYGHVYSDPNLLSTVNLWSWSDQCTWSSVPTLGLLKNLNACENGVPCPVQTGRQTLPVTLDFTKYNAIIKMLKDNEPYQLEYMLNDKASGDSTCLMSQAWAYIS